MNATTSNNQPCVDSIIALGVGVGNGAINVTNSAKKTFGTVLTTVKPVASNVGISIASSFFGSLLLFSVILVWVMVLAGLFSWLGGIILTVFFIILTYLIAMLVGASINAYIESIIHHLHADLENSIKETVNEVENTANQATHNIVNVIDKCLPNVANLL